MGLNIELRSPKNFLETYEFNIAPKLKEIDVFLKSVDLPIHISKIANILYITEEEIKNIMRQERIDEINPITFFIIMKNGSSNICRLFKRELECGTPYIYTPKDISYIYDIRIEKVEKACKVLGIHDITPRTLPLIFSKIPA